MNKMEAQRQVEEIMTTFDFEAVRAYMKLTNWTWRSEGVPTLESIQSQARDVMQTAIQSQYTEPEHAYTACGGFEARIDQWWGAGLFHLTLAFVPFRMERSFQG